LSELNSGGLGALLAVPRMARRRDRLGHPLKTADVDAVRCAAEVQRAIVDHDAGIPEDRRIRFRVGINLGDIIVEDDDIFADGVNVAARLEALSEPVGSASRGWYATSCPTP
jgi:class 3 adenylate cyclase